MVASRSDPDPALPGGQATTSFSYDAFNRLVAITDPNGLTTETQYADDLDRVRFVIRRAGTLGTDFELGDLPDPGAGDLVTESVYDGYGDLARTILPRENTIEYDYDHIGRLVSIGRAEDDQTHAAEQTEYTLDDFGRRTEESLQRWTGSVWEKTSATAYVFANRCHLDRIVHDPPTGSQITENAYDCNGNLTKVWDANHPSATFPTGYTQYAYDALDRLTSVIQPWGGTGGPPITTSSGPLASVALGNGRTETRAFTARYFPDRVILAPTGGGGALLDWQYSTDAVGNPTLIEDLVGSPDREYGYTPGTSGHSALLDHIDLAAGGTRDYEYTPAGHVTEVEAGANLIDFLIDQEGRLAGLERPSGGAASSMVYDGRGFLSRVEGVELSTLFRDGFERGTTECWSDGVPAPPSPGTPCSNATRIVEPLYDSAGLLHALHIEEPFPAVVESDERVLYLAGRPVAIARGELGDLDLLYLTTDHLGTPVAACDESGALEWSGGFEPFGTDWLETPTTGASAAGVWLRFAGQWRDESWMEAGFGADLNQNNQRWYEYSSSRYSKADPIGVVDTGFTVARDAGLRNLFGYAEGNPLMFVDPLGLKARLCCKPIGQAWASEACWEPWPRHC